MDITITELFSFVSLVVSAVTLFVVYRRLDLEAIHEVLEKAEQLSARTPSKLDDQIVGIAQKLTEMLAPLIGERQVSTTVDVSKEGVSITMFPHIDYTPSQDFQDSAESPPQG
jgi:hypothetical protein